MGLTHAHRWKRMRRAMACRLALLSPHALALMRCRAPLHTMSFSGHKPGDTLLVFLPGIGDVAEDFAVRGFVRAVAASDLPADAIAVDAHYGYYARRSVIDRLAHDIVLPARKRGYREIWLVGISMGGMGALSYAIHHPGHVARLVLLAPWLGEARLVRELRRACDDALTHPQGSAAEHVRNVWRWIDAYDPAHPLLPRLYLGYGTRDRFARANAMLAGRLARGHVLAIPGGHDWRTWKRLWDGFLARWAAGD